MIEKTKVDNLYHCEHIKGAIDTHIHGGPCLFKRIADDEEIAIAARDAGLEAVMIKSHSTDTSRSAYFVNKHVSGIKIFGGITLNWSVGGINPSAVRTALDFGGKEVWMPTYDAKNHADFFGGTGAWGTYDIPESERLTDAHGGSHLDFEIGDKGKRPGISILKNGSLTEKILEVVDLVREYNAIIGTSHLSKKEISILVQHAKKLSGIKILITHPLYRVPDCDSKFLKTVVGDGVYAEIAAATIHPTITNKTVSDQVELIKTLGAENCIFCSDGGIVYAPMPHEMIRIGARMLNNTGITNEELYTMMKKNPRKVLDI